MSDTVITDHSRYLHCEVIVPQSCDSLTDDECLIPMTDRREAVEKYLDGKIAFGELEEEIGEEAAEAVRESEKQLGQAEDLAGELSEP